MLDFGFFLGSELQRVEGAHEAFPAFGTAAFRLAQVTGAEGFAEVQRHRAFDQERGAELRTFGDEDPAEGAGLARVFQRTGHRCRDVGVQIRQVSLGRFGAASGRQIRDDGSQFGVVVQVYQLRLEQVLRDHETREVGTGFERRVGLDQGVELAVRLVGDLVQAL
ncbi:hypothetical protein I1A_003997 [Pseudomonas fluorescens R124]|uniref:Uncharacterized protein n=1 Tax=Pseudomonas fluorescens R124 TaxID=743713 RepID=A0A7U9CUA6_PSEFL|nr:hypothetical protein I1A_003997 [Pseudomonas fluorescens R124]